VEKEWKVRRRLTLYVNAIRVCIMRSLRDTDAPGTILGINPYRGSSDGTGMSGVYGLHTADGVIGVVFMILNMLLMCVVGGT
jgi:hypothetical protein